MNHLYDKALALRLKGYSYNEISKNFGIAKSTLSSWFAKMKLPQKAIIRLKKRVAEGTINGLVKRNIEQTFIAQKRANGIRTLTAKKVGKISRNDLLLIGTALYWAEGYKRLKMVRGREVTAHGVALTNSDPEIISTFMLFLREIIGVSDDQIIIEMRLFKHINEIKAVTYWMNITGLSKSQFRKPRYPISSASKGKRPKNRLPYGTIQVIVSNTKLFYRVIGYIDGLKQQLREKSDEYLPG